MFWNENEKTGYRHISVEYNNRVLMSIASYNVSGVWESKVIPMGFSFNQDEIQEFSNMFTVLPELMKFLCKEELTFEEINDYLLKIQ